MGVIENGSASTIVDGLCLGRGGTAFVPLDERSSVAYYERGGVTYGVHYVVRGEAPRLCFLPGWQVPERARSERAWNRFAFDHPDDRVVEMLFDARDGELRYALPLDPLAGVGDVERAIGEGLDFLEGLYPQVVEYVAGQLGCRG